MAEREKEEFVVTDRRKFRMDGDNLEHVPQPASVDERKPEPAPEPAAAPEVTASADAAETPSQDFDHDSDIAAGATAPSAEDQDASQRAYEATSERLDDLMRANNPGGPHEGPVTFDRVIQSLYVTAIVQLGLNTPAGQQMRVDLMAARHTIDMLGVMAEKTKGNTTPEEDKLLQTALFELRMSFLEITQMLAQNAQGQAGKTPGMPPPPGKVTL